MTPNELSQFGRECAEKLAELKHEVAKAQAALNEASSILVRENLRIETVLKEAGIQPITLLANRMHATENLYVIRTEGKELLDQYDYENPGTAYDMLFTLVGYPNLFVIIELTQTYKNFIYDMQHKFTGGI